MISLFKFKKCVTLYIVLLSFITSCGYEDYPNELVTKDIL